MPFTTSAHGRHGWSSGSFLSADVVRFSMLSGPSAHIAARRTSMHALVFAPFPFAGTPRSAAASQASASSGRPRRAWIREPSTATSGWRCSASSSKRSSHDSTDATRPDAETGIAIELRMRAALFSLPAACE